jgi:hypothetical protein
MTNIETLKFQSKFHCSYDERYDYYIIRSISNTKYQINVSENELETVITTICSMNTDEIYKFLLNFKTGMFEITK